MLKHCAKWEEMIQHLVNIHFAPLCGALFVKLANAVNNFFDNSAHPYISPRDSLSLTYLLGEISTRTGYTLGKAIGMENGELVDIPAVASHRCEVPCVSAFVIWSSWWPLPCSWGARRAVQRQRHPIQ